MNKILSALLLSLSAFTYLFSQSPVDLNPQVISEDGDFYAPNSSYGTVLTASDGKCYRIRVNVDGSLFTEEVNCPTSGSNPGHTPLNFTFDGYGGAANTQHSTVYAVTNLNDSGAGSLRAAPAGSYVVFPNLSGTINTNNPIISSKDNLWVMGQTSPAGIQVRGSAYQNHDGVIQVKGTDQVWQHIRIRPDEAPDAACCHSALTLLGGSERTVIDHMSLYWGDDESMTVYEAKDFSILNTIIAEGIHTTNQKSFGLIVMFSENGTVAKNLFALSASRGPFIRDSRFIDVLNNVSYGHVRDFEFLTTNGQISKVNLRRNIELQGGPASSYWQDAVVTEQSSGDSQLYVEGNLKLSSFTAACSTGLPLKYINGTSGSPNPPTPASSSAFVNTAHATPGINEVDICNLRQYIVDEAGAFNSRDVMGEPIRDALDARVINQMQNGGGIIPDTWGPWPTMTGGNTGNPWDLSKPDKLSDQAKIACGIDPAIQNTTQTFTNGGSSNDFLYIINNLYGL